MKHEPKNVRGVFHWFNAAHARFTTPTGCNLGSTTFAKLKSGRADHEGVWREYDSEDEAMLDLQQAQEKRR